MQSCLYGNSMPQYPAEVNPVASFACETGLDTERTQGDNSPVQREIPISIV